MRVCAFACVCHRLLTTPETTRTPAGNWQITLLTNAPNPNTYLVDSVTRSGNCYDLLAAYPCVSGYGPAVTTWIRVRARPFACLCVSPINNVPVFMRPACACPSTTL